jgi:hypothetical protein
MSSIPSPLPDYITLPALFRRECIGIQDARVLVKPGDDKWREVEVTHEQKDHMLAKLEDVYNNYLAFFYCEEGDKRSEDNVRQLLGDSEYTRWLLKQRFQGP